MLPVDAALLGPRVPGGRYYDGYWGCAYVVLEVHARTATRGPVIVAQYEGDARPVAHSTGWNARRDRVLATPGVSPAPENCVLQEGR